MRPDPSVDLNTLEPGALDRFTGDLIEAGFEPIPGPGPSTWEGPISPHFQFLTSATTMRIWLRPGWPYRHPYVYVNGLNAEHLNAAGVVCLWREDECNGDWLTLQGIERRIEEWCARAAVEFHPADLLLDAYLAFDRIGPALATFNQGEIHSDRFHDGQYGAIYGKWAHNLLLQLRANASTADSLNGRWYYRSHVKHPPRSLEEFRQSLTTSQRKNFDRGVRRAEERKANGLSLAVLFWHKSEQLEAVVLLISVSDGCVQASALIPAPTDQASLLTRAGPDASALHDKRIVVFGCGSIGSQSALLLCTAGIRQLNLVDGAVLRPGNVPRHLAGLSYVGFPKVSAVAEIVNQHAPWAEIETNTSSPMSPGEITPLLRDIDLALDLTGHAPFMENLCRLTEREEVPLISAALYRGGAVGRVRRQLPGLDLPIRNRTNNATYPLIPPDESERFSLEIGCNAPVNSAAPHSSAGIAALATRVAIDTLLHHGVYHEDNLEIYAPFNTSPFDRPGLLLVGRRGA